MTAAAFSSLMRQYSAGVRAPGAINRLSLITVSHDAIVSRTIVVGNVEGAFRMRFTHTPQDEVRNIVSKAPP